jgi:hypothetical protein
MIVMEVSTGCQGHEIMATLLIVGRSKADGSSGPWLHIISVLFMSLHVCTELSSNVFVGIQVFAG